MRRTALALSLVLVGCESDRGLYEQVATDSWYQAPNNEVDILFVVDDSCSMEDEQKTLSRGFASFTDAMTDSGTDFHIGVITTSFDYSDTERGMLRGDPMYLTNGDDYISEFSLRATVGIEGSDKEKGLEAASYAVSPAMNVGGPNEGFVRHSASLLVVVVSDEEDCSDHARLEGQPPESCYTDQDKLVPVGDVVSEFLNLKEDQEQVQIGAIVGVRNGSCDDTYPGTRYIDAARLTGGLVGDICEPDWSTMLGDLGLNAVGIRTSFKLDSAAQPASLEVMVNGDVVDEDDNNGWSYDENTCFITFNGASVPERDSEIVATYTIQSGGSCSL